MARKNFAKTARIIRHLRDSITEGTLPEEIGYDLQRAFERLAAGDLRLASLRLNRIPRHLEMRRGIALEQMHSAGIQLCSARTNKIGLEHFFFQGWTRQPFEILGQVDLESAAADMCELLNVGGV